MSTTSNQPKDNQARRSPQPRRIHYEPRRITQHAVSIENLPIIDPSDVRNSLYRENSIRARTSLGFMNPNLIVRNSLVLAEPTTTLEEAHTHENSFQVDGIRSLKHVDLDNSPSYVKSHNPLKDKHEQLLEVIMPTSSQEIETVELKNPNFRAQPKKSVLINSEGDFAKRKQSKVQKQVSVAFDEKPVIVEVENWKVFNTDTGKTKEESPEIEPKDKHCMIF